MNGIKKILSFLWRCWFGLVAVVFTPIIGVFLVLPFSFREKDYPKAYYFMRVWGFILFYFSGLWCELSGEKLKPRQQYIIVANHTSFMDIMLMLVITPNPMVFVGKAELGKIPIFGFVYNRIAVTVDRKSKESRLQVFKKTQAKLKQGYSICIFPEGGVPDDTSIVLDSFKRGAFSMSIEHHVPMAVHTICGMKEHMPYGLFTGYPGKVRVFRNAIIPADTYTKAEMPMYKDKVYEIIYNQLMACRAK
ncbi:lysophospholipid acyltransferase family protein [Ornithobacterium rhinotracheale]